MPKMLRMILRVLLLISFTCCVRGAFVVNVKQNSYQAEENRKITMEWTFTMTADTSPNSIFVLCRMIVDKKITPLFHYRGGVEVPEFQHKHFAGRVQCDKGDIRKGRVRLHVSRLKTEDSGQYQCEVSTSYGGGSAECHLNVTVRDQSEPETSNTASQGGIALYWSLGLTAAAVLPVLFY